MNLDVQACRLTAPQRSAVATIGVRGPQAVLDPLFRAASGRPLSETPVGAIAFGCWSDTGEELVVCRITPELCEIHCHGGVAAADAVLESLRRAGVTVVATEQWQLAEDADASDTPSVQAARRLLSQALTGRVAGLLLDQVRGAWDRAAEQVEMLLRAGRRDDALAQIDQLAAWSRLGRRLTAAWRVVLRGAPNAGKSTLMNRLLGYQRSVVWQQAGTTRDVVTCQTVLDGWLVELSDTAGIRATEDPLERAGAERADLSAEEADLIVEVVDASCPADLAMPHDRVLRVFNKTDLAPPPDPSTRAICAEDGTGVDALLAAIVAALVPEPPPSGAAIPVCSWQLDQLTAWRRRCRDGAGAGETESDIAPREGRF